MYFVCTTVSRLDLKAPGFKSRSDLLKVMQTDSI